MGKGGDLWDDSALVKAFDDAISKYKAMHRISGPDVEEKANTDKEEAPTTVEADDGNDTLRSHDEKSPSDENLHTQLEEGTAKNGENGELSQIKENCIDVQNGANGGGDSAAKPFDVHTQNLTAWNSSAPEEYNELLNKYYELEGQRQQVLQQINQYSSWNYQHAVSNASTSGYQSCAPQPHDTVTCYCPYGCQNWAVPINSVPACCSGKSKDSTIPGDSDFVQKAMFAAERALSSIKKGADGVEDKHAGIEVSDAAKDTKSSTDLDVVLSAWYRAGFYTGKYISEQSMEKSKHSQSP
ncbi:Unknown protein [Striga hermonthica]|uniref:Survival Motor Neuron Gemin2-binding domain-containing protein n=1 Tax=Striga hermonthica TaxID=68872 RepID=A0A9N7RE86_STRHE|nr:Unknown protein [Striga hermonthica]